MPEGVAASLPLLNIPGTTLRIMITGGAMDVAGLELEPSGSRLRFNPCEGPASTDEEDVAGTRLALSIGAGFEGS